jgi:predicted GNAT family N-acyltransferase
MIILNDQGLGPYVPAIDKLYRDCFDGLRFSESDRAEIRSILNAGEEKALISHAAIKQERYGFVKDPSATTWILGYVCTNGAFRGRGYARSCLVELFETLRLRAHPWIMVLNCKRHVVRFYEKCGFETIAEKASYDRNGKISVDDDPVMAKCSAPELMSSIERNAVLHLGEEF